MCLLGLRPELARVGGQDCDGPWVQQAPIGSRPIRSGWQPNESPAGDDRQISSEDRRVSQVKGQAIARRHPPESLIDPDRQEDHAHSQVHKRRNVLESLPDAQRPWVKAILTRAYTSRDVKTRPAPVAGPGASPGRRLPERRRERA